MFVSPFQGDVGTRENEDPQEAMVPEHPDVVKPLVLAISLRLPIHHRSAEPNAR
jgi:hypothetical protein